MKSFRCGKMEPKEINAVLLEVSKAYKEQKKRNDDAYTSLYSYMQVLQGYISQLNTLLQQAEYYKAYYEELCRQNNV